MKKLSTILYLTIAILVACFRVSWGQGIPDLSGLDYQTKSSIETACALAQMRGPAVYGRCINKQLADLRNSPGIPDLSGLDYQTKSSIETACALAQMRGPAVYGRCINKHLASIGINPNSGSQPSYGFPPTPIIINKPPSSVTRRGPDPNKVVSASSGSGFAVSSNGHVVTNHHVIKGCQSVKIHHNGRTIKATVVTFDPRSDLAILKGNFRPSTVLSLGINKPELLQDVYVAGFPFGRKISNSVKVTKGIISSLTGIGNNFSNIQIDAALQSGNSGGPILDDKGNVVGVAVARLDKIKTLKKFGSLPENTNFGIKTSVVRAILESSNISLPKPNSASISKSKLGKIISGATYYLSCWMTTAQIAKMRSQKVMFQSLD
jgi:S1-C subfamily serine protease